VKSLANLSFKAILCGLFIWLCTGDLYAQKLNDTISLREVKILGKRKIEEAGLNITHMDTLELKMMKTLSISEILSSFSPIFIKSYGRGSAATASFRGTASSHTQLYWNGIKLNSPMRGDVDFSLFPVYFIDDISLLYGGSSIKSGSGALGGSVLTGNKPDWTDQFSVRYIQTIESFSTKKEYLNVGFGNGRFQFKTRLFSDESKNDFPYFNYGVLPMHQTVQKNAGYSKQGVLQEIYTRMKSHFFSAKVWVYQSHRDLPQLMSFEGDIRKETQDDQNLRGVVSWKYHTSKSKLEWIGSLNLNNINYFRSSTEAGFVNFDSRSKERSYSNQVDFDWNPNEFLHLNWNLNSTYHQVSVFDRAQKLGYEHDRFELSLLNSLSIQASSEVSLSLLSRSELYDSHLIGFIPSIGVEYIPTRWRTSSIKLNLARNYHQPGLNDLYWLPGGNPDLKPEDGYTGDLTFGYSAKKENTSISGQLSGFASLIENWIVWQPSANGAFYWEASNMKKVFARGLEIQLSVQKNIAKAISVNLKGNYSHSATSNMNAVPSVDESRGKQLIYIPKDKANIFAEGNFKAWYLKINAPFTGKRYTSSNNVESDYEKVLNPYWLVNLTAGKMFEFKPLRMDLAFNIENLANTDYMAILWRPMPGRYYSLTIQIQYKK
jgi:iron complex outermembrane receptor protein